MLRNRARTAARLATGLIVGGVLALGASAPASASPSATQPGSSKDYRSACSAATTNAGYAHCDALVRTDLQPTLEQALAAQPDTTPAGYGPSSLLSAYNLASAAAGGGGQTVALVDAYNDPNANSDLAVYRAQYGLSACTEANGCFKVVSQTGSTTSLPPNAPAGDDWTAEESLDVDMVSAICPNCHIVLVEATSPSFSDLGTAMNQAVTQGAKFVSNSYGGSESSAETGYDTSYYDHPGIAVTASAGDSGYGVEYPAASQYVTSVGGTSLTTASNTRGWNETVWSGTGSGCSAYETKPTWQHDTGCTHRTVADVSADADPNTGVAVYDTYNSEGGWNVYGGTSVASPIIASTYALAGTPTTGSNPAQYPYLHTTNLNDVTSGSNGSCSPAYLCTGEVGYDGPTGLGTPNGTAAFTNAIPARTIGTSGLGRNADGRLEAFALGADGAVWHDYQVAAGGGWSGWSSLGGGLTTTPTVASDADGRLEIFARGTDGALWHDYQVTPGGGWSGWSSLGGGITSVASVGRNSDGRLEVFARGTDGAIWHIYQVAPNGGWSAWSSLGGGLTGAAAVASDADGRLEIFAEGSDGALWHDYQTTPGGAWSGWSSLGGGITSVPSVGRNSDGRLEVFAREADGAIWHIYQLAPNGGWSAWSSLGGGLTGAAAVASDADGRLEIFAQGTDSAIWHNYQETPGGAWSGWSSLGGGLTSTPAVGTNTDGRLEIFAPGLDGAIWHNYQVAPNAGWSGWSSLG